MKREEMRVLSARNSQLSNALPAPEDSTIISKRRSVDYGIRGRSIYKQEKSLESHQDTEAYSELKSLYEKALTENCCLKGESFNESSLSTVKLDKESSVKNSFCREIEDLQETLAETVNSLRVLKEYSKELTNNKIQAKKELDEQKTFYSFAKDNMVSLLQGKLNNTVDMLKSVYRDKKSLESILDKEEKLKHNVQAQCIALDEKLKVIEGKTKDLSTASALNSQISSILSKQENVNKKIEKYEAYIQSKMKKNQ